MRQVLTAGDKDQEVLDGGPNGHSVFTGRFIEILENTDDFITATEISTMLKEKVFSDAQARNHKQTPRYGELFGVGDFVFVPSMEQKVEDTKAKVAEFQKELERLKATEKAALIAQDEQTKRQAEIEKRAIEAKLKAEQLRQQALQEQKQKREQDEIERLRMQEELDRQKKAEDERLARLKKEVEEKRKSLGGTTLSSLSPEATIAEMLQIDAKIKEIKESFRNELKNGINQINKRLNNKFESLAKAKKDEFESEDEFKDLIAKEKKALEDEQTEEFASLDQRIESEYNKQIEPFIEQLNKLARKEFIITDENLILELRAYNAEFHNYPVTIKTKEPIKAAVHANIQLSGDEAREFKMHFENNLLRPGIRGSFRTLEKFNVADAYITDDSNSKQYYLLKSHAENPDNLTIHRNLFSEKYVNLGNGIVYDSAAKLLWLKNAQHINTKFYNWKDAVYACQKLIVNELIGWRPASSNELLNTFNIIEVKNELHPFVNIEANFKVPNSTHGFCAIGFRKDSFYKSFFGKKSCYPRSKYNGHYEGYAWCVRGSSSEGATAK